MYYMLSDIKHYFKKREGIKYRGWFFYNLPLPLSNDEYNEKIKEVVEMYKDTPGLIAIYQTGHVIPGISDLDFIFIFEDDNKKIDIDFDASGYIMMHGPQYLPSHLAKKMLYYKIEKCLNLKKLFDKNIKFLKSKKDFFEKMNLLLSIDSFYGDDRLLLNYKINRRIDVRFLLSKLHFFKTRKAIFEEASVPLKNRRELEKFCEHVRNLRENWFRTTDFDELIRLLRKSIDIISYMRTSLRSYLLATEAERFEKYLSVFLRKQFRKIFVFLNIDEKNMDRLNEKSKNIYFLPSIFQLPVFLYSKIKNPLGLAYSRSFFREYEKEPVINDQMLKKAAFSWIEFNNDLLEYRKRNNMHTILNPRLLETIKYNLLNIKNFNEYFKVSLLSRFYQGYLSFFRTRYGHLQKRSSH